MARTNGSESGFQLINQHSRIIDGFLFDYISKVATKIKYNNTVNALTHTNIHTYEQTSKLSVCPLFFSLLMIYYTFSLSICRDIYNVKINLNIQWNNTNENSFVSRLQEKPIEIFYNEIFSLKFSTLSLSCSRLSNDMLDSIIKSLLMIWLNLKSK